MTLHDYANTDSLYIDLKPEPGAETREIADRLNADLAGDGTIAGFDIDMASQRLDLSTLETGALPLKAA